MTDNAQVLISDICIERFPSWVKCQELGDFHVNFCVFGMQIMFHQAAVRHYDLTKMNVQAGGTFLLCWHILSYVVTL